MRYVLTALCALAVWAGDVMPVSAAWNNVFQPTLFGRHRKQTTSQYVAPAVVYSAPVAVPTACNSCPQPCAQQQCSTSYVQRCYYQPVTTYQSQSYYEPVTTYQTSYYYEPVTTYRYSSYYDPCSCGYQSVATPVTSYQLRSQSCPVQSWVQRCAQVPVTSYQKAYYWQPQTTCCQTTSGAPILTAPPAGAPVLTQPPAVTGVPGNPAPTAPPPPVVNENRNPAGGTGEYNRYYPQPQLQPPVQTQPPPAQTPNTSWQPAQTVSPLSNQPRPAAPVPLPANPPVKLERIVFGPDSTVDGQVVRGDNTPRPDTKLLFVSADVSNVRESATTNGAGRFQVTLATGGWMVYVYGNDGNPIFHSRIEVTDQPASRIILVNR